MKLIEYSVQLQEHCSRILFIDTLNKLNINSKVFRNENQESQTNRIFCISADNHYDLWIRLSKSEEFIKYKKIGALLINSISHVFIGADKLEVLPVLKHISQNIEYLTKKFNLVTLIGVSNEVQENVKTVYGRIWETLSR